MNTVRELINILPKTEAVYTSEEMRIIVNELLFQNSLCNIFRTSPDIKRSQTSDNKHGSDPSEQMGPMVSRS